MTSKDLAQRVADLEADTAACPSCISQRSARSRIARFGHYASIVSMPDSRARATAIAALPDPLEFWRTCTPDVAARLFIAAPDDATRVAWLGHLSHSQRALVRVRCHELPPRVRVTARPGASFLLESRRVDLSADDAKNLTALDVRDVVTGRDHDRGAVAHSIMRPAIYPQTREVMLADVFAILARCDTTWARLIADECDVETLTDEENRQAQLAEDRHEISAHSNSEFIRLRMLAPLTE